jgi:hypothetical protein
VLSTLLTAVAPIPAAAQEAASDEGIEDVATAAPATNERRFEIFGHVPERRRVIPAFWRTHPFDKKFPELAFTRGVGLQASGWLTGAFVNSYERFSVLAGVERAWLEANARGLSLGTGYRAGVVTGYDERLASWADEAPLLPFVGVLAWMQAGRVGVDAFYVYRAITLEGSIAF